MSREDVGPVVVVTHRVPAGVTPVGEWLAEIADRVVLVTPETCEPGYRGAFAEIVTVRDYSHGHEVADQLDRLCRERRVSRIVSGTEDDVLRVAEARERHGIPGMTRSDAALFTDKLLMKRAVRDSVTTPGFTADLAGSFADLVDRTGWPVVVKPRRSYGSRGVAVVHDLDSLLAQAGTRPPDDTIVEEYVPGAVHHVDGLMRGGRVLVSCPSRYVNDCLSFHDSSPLGSVQLDRDDPVGRELDQFAQDVVAALPPTDLCPFHLEVFRNADSGKLTFCEIACRLGGGHIREAMSYRLGQDPVRLWYRSQAGLSADPGALELSAECFGFLLVPPRRGTLREVRRPDLPDHVTDFFVETPVPRRFDSASASTDSVLAFVVRGADATTVEARLHTCTSLANDISTWED